MYDIIGDIHGYGRTLIALLEKLGYVDRGDYYYHPYRKVIFAGDFIDRGPNIRLTLKIVKAMVDNGTALAVMGNHEYNAVCYHTQDENGHYLRSHNHRKTNQIKQTLLAFKNNPSELQMYLKWFKTLPVFLEFPNLRVVHACWDFKHIRFIKRRLIDYKFQSRQDWIESSRSDSELFDAIEIVLKGKEIELPQDIQYSDKDGSRRRKIRFQWWRNLKEETYRSIAVNFEEQVPNVLVPFELFFDHEPYLLDQPPVFIGHYWKRGKPQKLSANVACLDYSVAKNGYLVAYRWDGEQELNNKKFVKVSAES